MKSILSILFILWFLIPYSFLFYRKWNLRVRLLFISLFEILFLYLTIIIVQNFKDDLLNGPAFFYNILIWPSIFLNLVVILIIWLIKRIKSFYRKDTNN